MSGPSTFAFVFEGVLLLPVSFAGVAVNIFNICFLVKERSKLEFAPSFVQLLVVLSIFDLLVLIVEIGIFGFPAISTWYTTNVYFSILPTWIGLVNIGRVGSVGATVSITIERYLSICHSHKTCVGKPLLLIIPSMFAVFYNIPKFFELLACDRIPQTQKNVIVNYTSSSSSYHHGVDNITFDNNSIVIDNATVYMECTPEGLRATPMRSNRWYIIFYSVLSKLLLVEIIPWVAVIVFNYLIWKKIREFQARRERLLANSKSQQNSNQGKAGQQTRILWGMVLVFIFCQSFTIVADIYELFCTIFPSAGATTFCQSNIHIENFIDVAHFMIAVNSSVNFIFYMVNIKEFREAFLQLLCLCCPKKA